jgi:hypothetical protein
MDIADPSRGGFPLRCYVSPVARDPVSLAQSVPSDHRFGEYPPSVVGSATMGRRRGTMLEPFEGDPRELIWRVDGREIRLGPSSELPATRDGWVALLAELLTCSLDEAATTYDDFFANDEFVRSVLTDIDRLADGETP